MKSVAHPSEPSWMPTLVLRAPRDQPNGITPVHDPVSASTACPRLEESRVFDTRLSDEQVHPTKTDSSAAPSCHSSGGHLGHHL
ncbi:hypothetical protein [Geodermatophilus sabuli]|uniref:hypothetical protein n=1 Tax=Geodermatophilus sabuli TaxID=1564158 RepID=UPI00117BCD4B|nr:hypothetical protein [Geodermatophilus sabuli]MBB3084161.1 hypothetical protein [Geodermatophilus sabuli]